PLMLLQVALLRSLVRPSGAPLWVCARPSLSRPLSVDLQGASVSGLLGAVRSASFVHSGFTAGARCPQGTLVEVVTALGEVCSPFVTLLLPVSVLSPEELRKLSWSGVPKPVRAVTWKLLSGYLPANVDRRPATLQRKQKEYFAFIDHYYDSRNDEVHQDTYRQIHIDIPRMSPEALVLQPKVTEIFERILFIWAIRHPASGYVQGMNDLVIPFFVVFLCEHTDDEDVDTADVSRVPEDVLRNVEADTYWCLSRLLDGIQDNYTFAQPGIQMKVKMLEELVRRIDEQVHRHLDQHEVRYLQFAFRWMNNLLMREVPLRCTIRLWDTYQSEPEGFAHFHLYVCAAFLVRWRKEILEEKDFQELLLFLQNLPTAHWGDEDISLLLAEAYRLKFAFADAPNHYKK
uniref:Rab-GAP TBC domain-containing protein n=1 Tax=Sus scrofa TaxID=9823 RepID=A0A8D1BKJ9_PIG